ncbi:3-phosphoshikimate 1-carboxyvinyltransferase [Serpentinicella sp. ANB-PHB4]|uniref:3-phosphoshikimate 1-carboxyvinyltransferase n=1 Tax=Serpentinicella sp. ANB-PHB4 TaxID=3074076 RepID=UPI002867A3C7|nr:3-phosphoshikimate 1-carboxyvinyltransferase [Serpentinicella sp. ANB-PHB4]MDR5658612.1 3-phosphoshikimate 1-carboxyvinyltransferase [Serpentinicella sp. ANB-PHB4]
MLRTTKVDKVNGKISVPGDKSISHRAIMIGSISKGKSKIQNFLMGDDCLSTINCFRKMGITIDIKENIVEVNGRGHYGLKEPEDILDAGNSGTTMRLMSGILSGQSFTSVITGDASLRKRPMDRIAIPLRKMGAQIEGRQGGRLAPLIIKGVDLNGIKYISPVSSAQVKSAVLLAGLYAQGETTVYESIKSRDHTERMLKYFGGNLEETSEFVTVKPSDLTGQNVHIPGDISSAAFFIAAAAAMPGSELIIENVGINPTRDGIIAVLKDMGAKIDIEDIKDNGGETVGNIRIIGSKLHGTTITADIIPRLIDEIPILAVIAAVADGITTITGAEELKVKESNRISTMVTEMKKLGIEVKELEDGMEIKGNNKITGATVESYGDHRIAMSMAIAGLFSEDTVTINGSECINVSFPNFEKILKEIVK